MKCDACKCVLGNIYNLPNGNCEDCGACVISLGTYIGRGKSNEHVFRLHPRLVCECGANLWYLHCPCDEFDGINVTEEFESIVYAKR